MSSQLSVHDKAVLNCIFNPSLPLFEAYNEENFEEFKDIEDDTDELKKVKQIEVEAVNKAENGEYNDALILIEAALKITPDKASLYNNRAQIYQLMEKYEDAFQDLTTAISLGNESMHKKSLCQSLCQRGLLHRKNNADDSARNDFARAAELGSKFAKSQLVELNPYAALCNQMLRKVMEELN